jgi:hypothetical protein
VDNYESEVLGQTQEKYQGETFMNHICSWVCWIFGCFIIFKVGSFIFHLAMWNPDRMWTSLWHAGVAFVALNVTGYMLGCIIKGRLTNAQTEECQKLVNEPLLKASTSKPRYDLPQMAEDSLSGDFPALEVALCMVEMQRKGKTTRYAKPANRAEAFINGVDDLIHEKEAETVLVEFTQLDARNGWNEKGGAFALYLESGCLLAKPRQLSGGNRKIESFEDFVSVVGNKAVYVTDPVLQPEQVTDDMELIALCNQIVSATQ